MMETLMVLVIIVAGGLFAYRQWHAIRELGQHAPADPRHYPPATVARDPSHFIIETADYTRTPPRQPAVSQGTPGGMNKYLVAALCAAWIICPLDGDWIPLAGWLDDLVAAGIGVRALLRS